MSNPAPAAGSEHWLYNTEWVSTDGAFAERRDERALKSSRRRVAMTALKYLTREGVTGDTRDTRAVSKCRKGIPGDGRLAGSLLYIRGAGSGTWHDLPPLLFLFYQATNVCSF